MKNCRVASLLVERNIGIRRGSTSPERVNEKKFQRSPMVDAFRENIDDDAGRSEKGGGGGITSGVTMKSRIALMNRLVRSLALQGWHFRGTVMRQVEPGGLFRVGHSYVGSSWSRAPPAIIESDSYRSEVAERPLGQVARSFGII